MLSVCIITKNEAKHLDECLKRIEKYGFEIIVVDTGSSDNSKEVAGKYTEHVYDFEWCDDFAKARNYAISKSTNEFVLFIDTDEYIEKLHINELQQLVQQNSNKIGRITIYNVFDGNKNVLSYKEKIGRIFSKKIFQYVGRIHEQIMPIDEEKKCIYYDVPVIVEHHGYIGSKNMEKAKRNLEILLDDYNNDIKDAYRIYQIGKCYYSVKDYENAIKYFNEGLGYDLNPKLEYVINMLCLYGYSLLETKRFEDALALEGVFDEFSFSADYLFVLGLIYMNNAMFQNAVDCFTLATEKKDADIVGVNGYLAYYNIGIIYECLGYKEEALKYYKLAGDYTLAKKRIALLDK